MENTKRIIISVVVLIGATLGFGYWSMHNFDMAFSSLDNVLQNNTANVTNIRNVEVSTTTNALISTSTEVTKKIETSDLVQEEFKFTFPAKAIDVYKGCKYNISWNLDLNSISISLLDAGTKEVMGPLTGGVPKNIEGKNIDSFEWKVGNVWPGKYYLLATNIDGKEIKEKSYSVNIMDVPEGLSDSDIEKLCTQ